MNILNRYSEKYARIVFSNYITFSSKIDFNEMANNKRIVKYIFKVNKSIEDLNPGDYVVVDTSNGLKIGIFVSYTIDPLDIQLAYRYIKTKVSNLTVFNYRK